jgi:hypothetical protein
MFPGYLFARFELASMHRLVRYSHGVSGIVRFADRYPTIEEEAMAQLLGLTDAAEVKELVYDLSEGDPVQIVGGVFVGLDAVVTQVLSAKERVKVLMDFLGRKMEAEVQWSSVLRQVNHPLAAWGFPESGVESRGIPAFESWVLLSISRSKSGADFGLTGMKAALQAAMESGLFEGHEKQPRAVACRINSSVEFRRSNLLFLAPQMVRRLFFGLEAIVEQ